MGAKRALIVDDSKSARVFLARVLENYDIDVDSAESAEAAIEYLTSNRPDVIFMDHMMPGMDGFQAVQVIKNDPRTATIPIMMYTSQEGELYLGQARALGAVGVLPKQIKPTDVSKVLYELHLVPERRNAEQASFTPLNLRAEGAQDAGATSGSRALTETTLREHFAELRRALVTGVDTQADRITAEVRALLLESLPPATPATAPTRMIPPWAWLLAATLLLIGLAGAAAWWRSAQLLEAVRTELTQQRVREATPLVAAGAATEAVHDANAAAAAEAPPPVTGKVPRTEIRPIIVPVPYGADALGGARLEVIRRLLDRLSQQKVTGVVDVRAFAGRFCLVGNAIDGFAVPPDEMPFAKCDTVGNPADESLSATQRTPLALANLIASVRSATHGALQVQVSTGEPDNLRAPYPTVAGDLTAGDWNRSGSANNRVEIRVP
jgi:CheY-like chemotaxis protein